MLSVCVFSNKPPSSIPATSIKICALNNVFIFHLFFFSYAELHWLYGKKVSWIRKRDLHILTVGILTYTNDQRFQSLHTEGSDEWALKVSSPQPRDSGTYECQVSTEPKISQGFRLHVVGNILYVQCFPYTNLNDTIRQFCSNWSQIHKNCFAKIFMRRSSLSIVLILFPSPHSSRHHTTNNKQNSHKISLKIRKHIFRCYAFWYGMFCLNKQFSSDIKAKTPGDFNDFLGVFFSQLLHCPLPLKKVFEKF